MYKWKNIIDHTGIHFYKRKKNSNICMSSVLYMNLVYTNLFLANNLSKTLFSYLKQICSCSVVGKDEG
jgi:hypothetical protein